MTKRRPTSTTTGSTTSTRRAAAIYLRQSKEDDEGIDRQIERTTALVNAKGWDLYLDNGGPYIDNDVSASKERGPKTAWARMLRDGRAGHFGIVVAVDLDRLLRSTRDLITLQDAGLAVITLDGEIDLTTADGEFRATMLAAVARFEVRRKAERQTRAAKQRAEKGKPPTGVRLTGYTTKGELVPEEAAVVRCIFDRFLDTENLRQVARSLNDDGAPTRSGSPWSPSTVQTILRNPRYAGRAIYQGEVIAIRDGEKRAWEPIVTDDDFETAQAILDAPHRVANTGTTARKHLGAGLYRCADCAAPLSSWSGARYRCRDGAHVNRARGPVDLYVTGLIVERLARPDVATLLAPAAVATAPIVEEITRLRARLARFETDYDEGLIDGRRYKSATDTAKEALRDAQARLAAAQADDALAPIVGSDDPPVAFLSAPLDVQRAVVDALAVVTLSRGHKYSKTFDPDTVTVTWR